MTSVAAEEDFGQELVAALGGVVAVPEEECRVVLAGKGCQRVTQKRHLKRSRTAASSLRLLKPYILSNLEGEKCWIERKKNRDRVIEMKREND